MRLLVALAATALVCLGVSSGARAEVKQAKVQRIISPPVIDGALDDEAWLPLTEHGEFVQRQPQSGAPLRDQSRFRVGFDEQALYVAVRAHDVQADRIDKPLARRDAEPTSDWIHVAIDTDVDGQSALEFAVNPAGVLVDALWTRDNRRDVTWDGQWTAAADVDDGGWSAEFRIPLASLRLPTAGTELGFQVWRRTNRTGEVSYWSTTPAQDPHIVRHFGRIAGLTVPAAEQRLSARQHVLLVGEHVAGARDAALELSLDVEYALSEDIVIEASLNPDFGFVEADPAEIHLSALERFVVERRQFFNSGRELFLVPLGTGVDTLLYSRRIGRPPQGRVSPADGASAQVPAATDVLAAGKLLGRVADRLRVGAILATTDQARARVSTNGVTSQRIVEPLTQYAAVRVVDAPSDASRRIGGLLTAVHRLGDDTAGLHRTAVTGAVDGSWQLGAQHRADVVLLGSWLHGSAESIDRVMRSPVHYFQRPDADHLQVSGVSTSLGGYGGYLRIAKTGGVPVRYGADLAVFGPGLELGDLGFLSRADTARAQMSVSHHVVGDGGAVSAVDTDLAARVASTFGGEITDAALILQSSLRLRNQWTMTGSGRLTARVLDPTILRGGPALRTEPSGLLAATVITDERKRARGALTLRAAADTEAAWAVRAIPELMLQPSPRLQVDLGLNASRSMLDHQFVAAGDDRMGATVGAVAVDSLAVTVRLSLAFTRRLSVQYYAQAFLSGANYHDFRAVTMPNAERYATRYAPTVVADEPDFAAHELHGNLALRWEIREAITLLVLWSHERQRRSDDGRLAVDDGVVELWETAAEDTILIKLSSWFSH